MKLAQTLSPDNSEQILFLRKEKNIEVVVHENKDFIWLTMDNIVQSAIERKTPYRPILPHCFVMLLPLLHDKEPQTVLELGAGALAFQRYLSLTHPNIKMTSVEKSEIIINATDQCFPSFKPKNIINEDAYSFVNTEVKSQHTYDWVMVDLFYGAESPFLQDTQRFVEKLQNLINIEGWLVINMLTKDDYELKKVTDILKNSFYGRTYLFAVPDMQNHIFLCKHDASNAFSFPPDIEQHNLAQ